MNNQINNLNNNEINQNNNINLNKEKNFETKESKKQNDKELNNISNINWNKISEKLENKNARQCQTRWQNILDPNRIKGPWTKEEDLKLIELVKKFGPEKWSNISTYLPGRLGKQCRERWYNHLNPEVRKTGWSKEEEWALFLLHRKYGNSWSTFSEKIPGRTDNTIKNHWNSIMKKNIVSINNQYQEMIKGKSKEEIEVIEKNIMDKCNQVMNKDYNEYYKEKMKEFPMMMNTKLGKKSKEKDNKDKLKKDKDISNNNSNINILENENIDDIKKTPTKVKKKIFENIKVNRNNKSPKNKIKNKLNEKNEESKEKKHKNNKKQNSEKKNNKYFYVNDEKELKILKSGEKILQKDKNMLIKEAENKFKEKQKLKKDEKKSKLKNILNKSEEIEEINNSLDNLPTYINKKHKIPKKKLGRPKLNTKKKKTKFNVSKLSSHNKVKEKESPNINNININQKISFQNNFINNFNTTNQINPNYNTDFIPNNNNINIPYPIYPPDKNPYYMDEDKDFTKLNFNRILITDSKDLNKSKKESQFPFKVPPTVGAFYRSDIKNSSESSGGNNSLGKITPDFRMNPPFIPSNNDKYYVMPQTGNLFFNSNPKVVRCVQGVNNNNNNKISTDSNSIHSYSMNQSMLSANSAFKKSSSGSGSGSGRSFQPRPGAFSFNNMADLNKEYFSNINIDEKNLK